MTTWEPVDDVGPADWLVAAVADDGTVAELVTGGFAAYARVLHRPDRGEPDGITPTTWAEVAAAHGTVLHPAAHWGRLSRDTGVHGPHDPDPTDGTLDRLSLPRLRDVLLAHTTSELGWFGMWEGQQAGLPSWDARPRFALPGRDCWLLRGPLAEVVELSTELEYAGMDDLASRGELTFLASSRIGGGGGPTAAEDAVAHQLRVAAQFRAQGDVQSPTVWWPDDRAWVVGTDVDLVSTFVGGSAALISDLLAHPGLEVLAVPSDQSLADAADTVN